MWGDYSRLKRLEIYNQMQCVTLNPGWREEEAAIKKFFKQIGIFDDIENCQFSLGGCDHDIVVIWENFLGNVCLSF